MLDNFREIYNKELSEYDCAMVKHILNSSEIRAFVYEVCKYCIEDELARQIEG